jgi:6-phosphogluconate dehydrogenase
VKLGYDRSLFLVAFDHRSSFSSGLFGASEPLPPAIVTNVEGTKAVIFDAFEQAIREGAPRKCAGILVDERFGAEVAREAKTRGYLLAMPVEASGQREFQFEYGADFGRHIEAFDPDFCKVLVRYNPDGDRALNRRQTDKLALLSTFLHARDRKFLFELLVPATEEQLQRCGGQERFDRELRAGLVVDALRELQAGGVEPDIWKIEGLESREDCARVVAQARAGVGREGVVAIVLGRGADMNRVKRWLEIAAPVPGFVGFAVGRTLWNAALQDYVAGASTRGETASDIADRFLELIDVYAKSTRARSTEPSRAETAGKGGVMELGMIGLGRMGANMASRLLRAGHRVVAYNRTLDKVLPLIAEGAGSAESLARLVEQLKPPRAVWMMLPAAVVEETVTALAPLLARGDTIIDGGNSYYRDDIRRARALASAGIHYVDVGTSGGVWGKERGYCQMIGGDADVVKRLAPIFAALAPGVDAATRTPGRTGAPIAAEQGYLRCGPSGAGHFVKMVHNGIEYGLMAAYAEGLNILRRANVGKAERAADAETAPLEDPELYQYDFDLRDIAEVWRRGSVIASWLLDLTAAAFVKNPELSDFAGRVSDSGEGRWTLKAAVDEGVPAPILATAISERFASRGQEDFAYRVLSAMRSEFGGHAEKRP